MSTNREVAEVAGSESNNIPDKELLECGGKFITIELTHFWKLIAKSLPIISSPILCNTNDIKISCTTKKPFIATTVEEIYHQGFNIVDYYIYRNYYKPGEGIELIYVEDKSMPSYTDYLKSIFSMYFILLTRGKLPKKDSNDKLPRFLVDYMGVNFSISKLLENLSENDMDKMDNSWILKIKINGLPAPVKQRISNGIAGFRLFSIFRTYIPKNVNTLDVKLHKIYKLVHNIAMKGPVYEMHPYYMHTSLASISVSRNLSNLIIDIFTSEEISTMVKNKSLFETPKIDRRYNQYLNWDDDTFNSYKTPIFDE